MPCQEHGNRFRNELFSESYKLWKLLGALSLTICALFQEYDNILMSKNRIIFLGKYDLLKQYEMRISCLPPFWVEVTRHIMEMWPHLIVSQKQNKKTKKRSL